MKEGLHSSIAALGVFAVAAEHLLATAASSSSEAERLTSAQCAPLTDPEAFTLAARLLAAVRLVTLPSVRVIICEGLEVSAVVSIVTV